MLAIQADFIQVDDARFLQGYREDAEIAGMR
jgi:hypothetical protein